MEFTAKEYANIHNARLVCIHNASARIVKERVSKTPCFFGDYGQVVAFLELEDPKVSVDKKRTVPAYLMVNAGNYTVC